VSIYKQVITWQGILTTPLPFTTLAKHRPLRGSPVLPTARNGPSKKRILSTMGPYQSTYPHYTVELERIYNFLFGF
jgi:hypothetical protein